ncbi:MAG: transporter substrate-binding domain-containing protein [Rhodospirillales bacterium]|nr:transporter substrate-binding domain-containing protein [Rhodospirillales bacterium]
MHSLLFTILVGSVSAHAEQTLNYGLHQNKPLNFKDDKGQVKGLVIDVFSHVAQQENWKINYQPCTWAECLARLENGEIDVLSAIGFTEKRSQIYDFTDTPIITNWGLAVTQPKSKINSLIDLSGKVVAVMKKAGHTRAFKEMLNRFRVEAVYLEVDSFKEVLEAVSKKRADAGVINRLFASQYSKKFKVKETSIIFNPIEIRYAFTKGKHKALVETLDRHLSDLHETERSVYYQSLERWFGKASGNEIAVWLKSVAIILAVVGIILLGLTLFFKFEAKKKSQALAEEIDDHTKTQQENESLFKAIVHSGPASLIISDAKTGRLIYANQRAKILFDIAFGEDETQYNMIQFFESNEQREELREILNKGGILRDREVMMKRCNGQVFWASVTANPMLFKGQDTFATSILDITERKAQVA